jgi:hypothetical protein
MAGRAVEMVTVREVMTVTWVPAASRWTRCSRCCPSSTGEVWGSRRATIRGRGLTIEAG